MSLEPAWTDTEPPLHPELVRVLREMAIAPRDQKLAGRYEATESSA